MNMALFSTYVHVRIFIPVECTNAQAKKPNDIYLYSKHYKHLTAVQIEEWFANNWKLKETKQQWFSGQRS